MMLKTLNYGIIKIVNRKEVIINYDVIIDNIFVNFGEYYTIWRTVNGDVVATLDEL